MIIIIIIVIIMFVNRKEELEFLEERWGSKNFEFIVIYGRRRIGKTEIIKQFMKNKQHIYFLCDKRGTKENIMRFKKKIANFLNEPLIETDDLEEIFSYFVKKTRERVVVVFDEFPYLVEKDASIPSVFQRVIDNVLRYSRVFLIICGSSMSMMERGILSYKSPLYGRKTGHLKVRKLKFSSYFEFYPQNSIERNIEFYSITGGIPFYMEKFTSSSTFRNIKREIASKRGRLFEEVEFLLKEEFREPETYKKIIEAIAKGKTKLVEIANYSSIPATQLTKYITALLNLEIIEKEKLVTERKPKSKKVIYFINDNFFDFYFNFIEPFLPDLTIDEFESFEKNLKERFNQYVGKKFERLIREEVVRKCFRFEKIGKWWGAIREKGERKQIEIDVVALNERTKQILFAECKWKSKVNPEKICKELTEKTDYVQWHNEKREETFAVFAKSFKKKINEFEGKKVHCFDLKDLERILRNKHVVSKV